MILEQNAWIEDEGWDKGEPGHGVATPDLVLVFAGRQHFEDGSILGALKEKFSDAIFMGCSTAGEIYDIEVHDDTFTYVAIAFEHTQVKKITEHIPNMVDSFAVGQRLADGLAADDLSHVFVLSDGLAVNGTELVKGLCHALPSNVTVTGGLAGDGAAFDSTYVIGDTCGEKDKVTAIGLYGERLKVGYGSMGGWDSFGAARLITRANGNRLYEMDHRSALSLYKKYLGEHASGLPATALLFPLSLTFKDGDRPVVRTILSIDEDDGCMIFAGDVPEGAYARLMNANFDRLVDGAAGAAEASVQGSGASAPALAILISCVGRKLVLNQRIEEEVEAVRDILGDRAFITGFYSYGEISPFEFSGRCELHNQTMTITTLTEV